MHKNTILFTKFGLTVSLSALIFQTCVLYPWHKDISKQIENIDKKINLLLPPK